jgi:hypothetical protein
VKLECKFPLQFVILFGKLPRAVNRRFIGHAGMRYIGGTRFDFNMDAGGSMALCFGVILTHASAHNE